MKFYVATTLTNAPRAALVAAQLEAAGHTITYPWWTHGAIGHAGVGALITVAQLELRGVLEADGLIVLLPGKRGSHVELGAALGAGKPVIIFDEPGGAFKADDGTCAFYWHPNVHQLRGDLSIPTNMAILVHQAQVVVEEQRAGRLGRGAYGHAAAIASRLGA